MRTLTVTRPDDWHVHFRDGDLLQATVSATALTFERALVMPNLLPPLTTTQAILAYRERILSAVGPEASFTPYMTFYLNSSVREEELLRIKQYPFILGGKLYPQGVTTHSEQGVRSIRAMYPLFALMQENDWVLQIHGEQTEGDIFEREEAFIVHELQALIDHFPTLRVVLEHISTRKAVAFVEQSPSTVAATITPHHLMYNRNQLLAGGIKPHFYCLPILKHASDQSALRQAAISGNPKFFAGTDSAPHYQSQKENACGCAGIYSAPYAMSFYASVFDELGHLDKLNGFTSVFGAEFYRLECNKGSLELIKKPQTIPSRLPLGNEWVIPMGAGSTIPWSINRGE